jgi:hypothetical protein
MVLIVFVEPESTDGASEVTGDGESSDDEGANEEGANDEMKKTLSIVLIVVGGRTEIDTDAPELETIVDAGVKVASTDEALTEIDSATENHASHYQQPPCGKY